MTQRRTGRRWFQLHDTLRFHPKTQRLAYLLGVDRPQAIGHLVMLLTWVLSVAPDGDISGYDEIDIALACEWGGDKAKMMDALVGAGFVEKDGGGTRVHNWLDYYTNKARANEEKGRRQQKNRDLGENVQHTATRCDTLQHAATPCNNVSTKEEKRKEKKSISTPLARSQQADSSPAAFTFTNCSGSDSAFVLTERQVGEWATIYPGVDVMAEVRKADAWLKANPTKRKTARGMPKFLNNWLARTQDSGGSRNGGRVSQPERTESGRIVGRVPITNVDYGPGGLVDLDEAFKGYYAGGE